MKRIVIVGGGVIGLSVAWHCARAGLRVTVLERLTSQRDGCSFGNAGMICPSHFVPLAAPGMVGLGLKWMWNPKSPFYIRPRFDADLFSWGVKFWRACSDAHVRRAAPLLRDLSLASRQAFVDLASQPGIDFGLAQEGLLMLCKTQHALDEEAAMAQRARDLGIPAEVFDARQIQEKDPGITRDILGGVYFPKDCHLAPGRFMAALESESKRLAAVFHWGVRVLGWRKDRDRITSIQTDQGDFTADEFVLCGGSWSSELTRPLGLRIPMQAGKGYSLTLPHPPELPRICCILTEARVAVTPIGTSLRFGGTMEIAGLDETIHPLRVQGIIDAAARYFPGFTPDQFEGVQPWRGLRPVSPDGLAYLGRTGRFRNLTIATGHAMLGLSLAPISGRLISQVLQDQPTELPLELLSPDRHG